jgi:hypothetical protein
MSFNSYPPHSFCLMIRPSTGQPQKFWFHIMTCYFSLTLSTPCHPIISSLSIPTCHYHIFLHGLLHMSMLSLPCSQLYYCISEKKGTNSHHIFAHMLDFIVCSYAITHPSDMLMRFQWHAFLTQGGTDGACDKTTKVDPRKKKSNSMVSTYRIHGGESAFIFESTKARIRYTNEWITNA